MARKSRKANTANTEQTPIKVNRTGVYIRRSVYDDGHGDNSPIENQKDFVITKLADFSDVNIEKIYVDNGFTGTNFDRDAWQELIYDMQTGKINCIAVRDLSRIGRNFLETGNYLEKVFPFLNIRVISINDKYDSSRNDYNKAMLERCYKNLMHEFYSIDISTKITTSLKAKRSMGQAVQGGVIYGYIKDKDNKCLAPDKETSPVVKKIFELRSSGKRICEIRDILNKLLIPSPGRYKYLKSGGKKYLRSKDSLWSDDVLAKILKDEMYTGKLIQHKISRSIFNGGKIKHIDRSEWDIKENAHIPLITQELFDAVNSIPKKELGKRKLENHLVRKVRCGKCGCRMARAFHKYDPSNNTAWICQTHIDKHKENCQVKIRLSEIREIVKASLKVQIALIADRKAMIENALKSDEHQKKSRQSNILINTKQDELYKIKHSLAELYEDYKEGLISADEYEYAKAAYKAQQEEKETELNKLCKMNASLLNTKALIKRVENIVGEFINTELDDKTLFSYVDEIVVYSKERLEIRFSFSDIFEGLELSESELEVKI